MLDLTPYSPEAAARKEGLTMNQQVLLDHLKDRAASTYLWYGSVRQSKTSGAVIGMATQAIRDVRDGVGNGQYILGGVTIETVVRNQKLYWEDVAEQLSVPFKHWRQPYNCFEFGDAAFYIYGGDNEGSAGRLRGLTATSAYIDEPTKCVQSFVDEAEYRCSFGESFLLLTTNTDSPNHWVKTEYGDRDDAVVITSDFYENHHFSDERRAVLVGQNEDTAHYKRNILNLWVPDQGCVYPIGGQHVYMDGDFPVSKAGVVGLDIGTSGITAATMMRRKDRETWCADDELVHNGKTAGLITEEAFLVQMALKWPEVVELVIDPSAVMFIARARQMGYKVFAANNDVLAGIQSVNNGLYSGKLLINQRCTHLLREASSYVWNEKTRKPVKKDDHSCDSLRYVCQHLMPATGPVLITPR